METKTLLIFVTLFLIVSMVSLGIFIYYIRNKKSNTDQVLSLLNTKVSQMKNQLEDSKTNHNTSISNLEDKIVSIEENISSLNDVSNSNTNMVQSNLDDQETSITTIINDYDIMNSNLFELKEFEGKFTSSLADLNSLFDDRKLYIDDKLHTLQLNTPPTRFRN